MSRLAFPLLLVIAAGLAATAREREKDTGIPGLVALAAEPFVLDLPADRAPASSVPVDASHPLALVAARGHAVSSLLVLRAGKALPSLELRPGPLRLDGSELGAEAVTLRIVRVVRRSTPLYVELAGSRLGRKSGVPLPDILVRDEPAFEAAVAAGERPLPDEDEEAPTRTSRIAAGGSRYLLLTIDVPRSLPPGDYAGAVEVREGSHATSLPIRLTVRPFVLEAQRGKVLGVYNDFGRPEDELFEPSLELLRRLGMNSTRVTDLTALPEAERSFRIIREYGILHLVQDLAPETAAEVRGVPEDFDLHYLVKGEGGVFERLAGRLRKRGARIMAARPRTPDGAAKEKPPPDWAEYELGLEHLKARPGEMPRPELMRYVAKLQKDFRRARWSPDGPELPSKHPWRETVRWPQGLVRYPFFGRLLYGYWLFGSHLDGARARTLCRDYGMNPHVDSREPVSILAYPGDSTFFPTYSLEAIREGVTDLRYAQQAYRAVARLLAAEDTKTRGRARGLRRKLVKLLEPWSRLVAGGARIDLADPAPEKALRKTREALAELIEKAR